MQAIKSRAKSLFILVLPLLLMISLIPMQKAQAYTFYSGGFALSTATQNVYSSASSGSKIGTIYKSEGITVLEVSGNTALIEYSTSSGTKRGYLYNPSYWLHVYSNNPSTDNSSVAYVNTSASVYYGPSSSGYQRVGSVSAGEYVVVFGESNGWAYIEYNTTSGRKRGYVPVNNIEIFYWNRLKGNLKDVSVNNGTTWISGRRYVYAGPSTQYFTVGYVQDENVIEYDAMYRDADGNLYQYIEYYVNGTSTKKSGFMPI